MTDIKYQELPYEEKIRNGNSDSILASFLRDIRTDLGIDENRFQTIITRYVTRSGMAKNAAEVSSIRSGLRRELSKSSITWKGFFRAMDILRADKIEIRLRLWYPDKKFSEHEYLVHVRGTGDSNTVLATFLRGILSDLKVNGLVLHELITEHLERNVGVSDPTRLSSDRSGLRRELMKDILSWRNFFRALVILRVIKLELRFLIHHENKQVTSHTKTVVVDGEANLEDNENDTTAESQ